MSRRKARLILTGVLLGLHGLAAGAGEAVHIRRDGPNCNADPNCINRIHHALPMHVRAEAGQRIVFETRNSSDFNIDPNVEVADPRRGDVPGSTVHPLTGPVYIEGAGAGDVLAVKIIEVIPGDYGITALLPFGFISDLFPGLKRHQVLWRLNPAYAVSEDVPGVRIPNAAFPGVITVLPDAALTARILRREQALAQAGGAVGLPEPVNASPAAICGPGGSHRDECLRTGPPREHGGNLDIRHTGPGATVYLPCRVAGCGLAIGDVHYAQGDGEVAGTAIEMDATVVVDTAIVRDREVRHGVHYEGPSRLLDIPSKRFYATTGLPLKAQGEVPPDMRYLASSKVAELENLSKDLSLAARNALAEMLQYLTAHKGLTRKQAYVVMSVAVDLRVGQVVDAPNAGVSAVLPLDIFVAGAGIEPVAGDSGAK